MTERELHLYTVKINRWDVYQVRVEARSPADAEEKALEIYEQTEDYEQIDGGVNSVYAEREEE